MEKHDLRIGLNTKLNSIKTSANQFVAKTRKAFVGIFSRDTGSRSAFSIVDDFTVGHLIIKFEWCKDISEPQNLEVLFGEKTDGSSSNCIIFQLDFDPSKNYMSAKLDGIGAKTVEKKINVEEIEEKKSRLVSVEIFRNNRDAFFQIKAGEKRVFYYKIEIKNKYLCLKSSKGNKVVFKTIKFRKVDSLYFQKRYLFSFLA